MLWLMPFNEKAFTYEGKTPESALAEFTEPAPAWSVPFINSLQKRKIGKNSQIAKI